MNPKRLVYGTGAALLVASGLVAAGLVFAQGQSAAPATPEQAAVLEEAAGTPEQAVAQQQTPAPAPAPQQPVTITADQARSAALAAVPGTVLELEMDDEGGRATFEVSIRPQAGGPEREVVVDASTGAVLSNTVDDEGADDD